MQFIADVHMKTSVVAVAMTMENNGEQLVYSGRSSQENLLMDWIQGMEEELSGTMSIYGVYKLGE